MTLEQDWTPTVVADLLTDDGPGLPLWTAATLTVLVETAYRWPHIATRELYPLLRQHPRLAVAAGGATLTRLAGIPEIDMGVLDAIEQLLPAHRHIALDIAAAVVGTLARYRLKRTNDPAEKAAINAKHAWRLANAGGWDQALALAEQAVAIRRQLPETNPDAHLSDLAMALRSYAIVCVTVRSSLPGAHDAVIEAINLFTKLAEQMPGVFLGQMVVAYHAWVEVLLDLST